jgi:type VI secretion system secreted protein VgrG
MAIDTSRNGTAAMASLSRDRITIRFPHAKDASLNDAFRVVALDGTEEISRLYHYTVRLVTDRNKPVAFDKVVGQRVTVQIPRARKSPRLISGVVYRLTREPSDETHAHYQAEIVPGLWTLTKIAQSRIFQDLDATRTLFAVVNGCPSPVPTTINLKPDLQDRPYCVQYRETDFNFMSRFMEEKGIHYYFQHDADRTEESLRITDEVLAPPFLPGTPVIKLDEVRGGNRPEERVTSWRKTQELRAAVYALRDHSFELPRQSLETRGHAPSEVSAGSVKHRLDSPYGKSLEIYDYPGDYAARLDSVSRGGGNQPAKLEDMWTEGSRTANIRLQQEAVPALVIEGASTCAEFQPGHRFALEVKALTGWKPDGEYLLTAVRHRATQPVEGTGFAYDNEFSCIPVGVPFRPPQRTPKPTIQGTQTAVVVGSGAEGEELFVDKYGRVKVRFFWDRRDPKKNPDSCWIRVAQAWAGKRWGASFWPRIGQEVVVAFEEGDPDRPLIIGSVYNAEQLPPYLGAAGFPSPDPEHPNDPKVSGVKTCSTPGGQGFNELRFDDAKGKEQVFLHAQRNLDVAVCGSHMHSAGGSYHLTVGGEGKDGPHGDLRELVHKDHHYRVKGEHKGRIDGNSELYVAKERREVVKDHYLYVQEESRVEVFAEAHYLVSGNRTERVKGFYRLTVDEEYDITAGRLIVESTSEICFKVGSSFITINKEGVWIQGPRVDINCGHTASVAHPINDPEPLKPEKHALDEPEAPAGADHAKTGFVSAPK